MPVSDWSTSAALNKSIAGIGIDEGMAPGDVDGAIRALMAEGKTKFDAHDSVIAAITTSGVATMTKDTQANLYADLAHGAGTIALVYGDASPAKNDLYVKAGASGSGSWSAPLGILSAAAQAAASTYATAAASSASAAAASAVAAAAAAGASSTVGNTIADGGIAGATAVFWTDNQHATTAPCIVTAASVYIDTVGDGTGYFVWLRPAAGGGWILHQSIPVSGIASTGAYAASVTNFSLPTGSIFGWYAKAGGAQIDIVTSGGANINGLLDPTAVGGAVASYASNAFIVKAQFTATSSSLITVLLAATAGVAQASTADFISTATASVAGFVTTVTGSLSRDNGLIAISGSRTVTAAASGKVRYDVLYYDAGTLALGVVTGTERTTTDPEEFIPAIGASSRLPLFNLRVTNTSVTAVPVWYLDDGEPRALRDALAFDRRKYRRAMTRSRGKINRLASLKIGAIGDSIVAMQGALPDPATPNGGRDQAAVLGAYLGGSDIGTDVIATLPLYTAAQLGHAADAYGTNHTRFGFVWSLVAALEAYGYTLGTNLTYNNWGIAGLSSADLVSGASPSTWMSAAIADAPDILIVNMGMNEYGAGTTEANMRIALAAARAAGIECLVMGVVRKNSSQDTSGWLTTNRQLRRAADYTGSAFVDLSMIYEDTYLGAIGTTSADFCGTNHVNHPSPHEHSVIGTLLSRMVLG